MSGPDTRQEADRRRAADSRREAGPAEELHNGPRTEWEMGPPPTFPHPPWTVALVLVLGLVTLVLGLFGHWLWLLAGSPFLLVLGLWLYVQAVLWRRRRQPPEVAPNPHDDANPPGSN